MAECDMTLPELPLDEWRETLATLHRWSQMVGKIQLALTPLTNHYWNVTFRPSARGLETPALPYRGRELQMELDFVGHRLSIRTSDGGAGQVAFEPKTVAAFYRELVERLAGLDVDVPIWDHPVEIAEEAIPFHEDEQHRAYDPEYAGRCWRILAWSAEVLEEFRGRFLGKSSPVHFFWGSFDLALTRFSGRPAPIAPDADPVTREAYSHEVSSVGFWPGDSRFPEPAYYSYAAPKPDGFEAASVGPESAFWSDSLGEYLLPYEAVRSAPDPRRALLDFAQSTYEAAADCGAWDRAALERAPTARAATAQ